MRKPSLESLEARRLLSTFYVSTTGSDSAAGTSEAPWRTLQNAANRALAGDIVDVRAGHYAGFQQTRSGTAAAPITFTAEPNVVVDQTNYRTPDGINLESASYVIVRGFNVIGMPRAGIRSSANTGAQIIGNNIDSNGYWGILTAFSQNILIENNVVSRSAQQHGIYVANSADNPIVRGNTVWGNRQCGIQINSDASQGGDGIITAALVEKNRVYSNGLGGGAAINLDGVQSSNISNNLLYENYASGVTLYQADGAQPAKNNVVVNNTIVMVNNASWNGRYALDIQNGSTGNTALNNILYSYFPRRGGAGSINISADSLAGFIADFNIVNDTSGFCVEGAPMNFGQWKSATAQDAHSLVTTPDAIFSNASALDFRLKAGSAAIDRGTSVRAPLTDIDGIARPSGTAIDIGAYEYASRKLGLFDQLFLQDMAALR